MDSVSQFVNERRRVYTETEVSHHNCEKDCWVSIFNVVYDLTELIKEFQGPLVNPLIKFAGKDISDWFDEKTGNVKMELNSQTNIVSPVLPHGRFVHVPPSEPIPWKNNFKTPWWEDEKYKIGILSKKTRIIRIINVLTKQEKLLEVCSEETMREILDRYLNYNAHAASYTWKVRCFDILPHTSHSQFLCVHKQALFDGDFVPLNMDKTLEQNSIPDESKEFSSLSIEEDYYYPPIYLYFNDDLTEA